jgi:hypothetical protein
MSKSVHINYKEEQTIEISLGSLYPPGDTGVWRDRAWVRVNGSILIDQKADFYPAKPDEIYIGSNPLGGSTCGGKFTGTFMSTERMISPSGQ